MTSIAFNATLFQSGYWAVVTDVLGSVPTTGNTSVRVTTVESVAAQLRGTVTAAGSQVTLSSTLGNATLIATNYDNSGTILFKNTATGVYYVFSNAPLSAGEIIAYTGNGLGDYHVPCYVTGTLILTAKGQVPVEQLAVGDLVVTVSGAQRPIRWIGNKTVDCAKSPLPQEVLPVRICAGALAPGLPARNLLISPDHALFFDDVLIPAKALVNGATVAQIEAGEVTYYGIELESHDMILAEGVAAESYLDDGQRNRFDNYAGDGTDLDPLKAFKREGSFRPLQWCGRRVAEVRGWIDARAAQIGRPAVRGVEADVSADEGAGSIAGDAGVVGFLERVSREEISGWCWREGCPDEPVVLELHLDGERVATFVADDYRPDLQRAKIGAGHHAFRFRLPPQAYAQKWMHAAVRVRSTGKHLANSPALLTSETEPLVLV